MRLLGLNGERVRFITLRMVELARLSRAQSFQYARRHAGREHFAPVEMRRRQKAHFPGPALARVAASAGPITAPPPGEWGCPSASG